MKRAGAIMLIVSLVIVIFLPLDQTFKYVAGAFGIVGGIVLIGISGYSHLE